MAQSFTPANIIPGTLLPGSTVLCYTVPVLTKLKISQLTLTNTDITTSHKVLVYFASNSSPPSAKDLLATVSLAPGQTVSVYQALNAILEPGATIWAQSDADSVVTLKGSGFLIV